MKRPSDNDPYVGHACQTCGERVLTSDSGAKTVGGFWKRDPRTGEVKAWHLTDACLGRKVA